jgi:ATP-binding cassette subfamily B protein
MYQRSMAAIERAMGLLGTPIGIAYEGKHFAKETVSGEIRFENLVFSYAGAGDTPKLHNISLTIPAGQTVAFVGSTGSGKSILLKLLLRFYTPQQDRAAVSDEAIAAAAPGPPRQRNSLKNCPCVSPPGWANVVKSSRAGSASDWP